jgi:hypothetical protein
VGELGLGVVLNVASDIMPIARIIPDLFAVGADGE